MEIFDPSPHGMDAVRAKYPVRYVALKGSFGLPFMEDRIRLNPRYNFKRVQDFGNVLVYAFAKKPVESISFAPPRQEYREAIARARREAQDFPQDAYIRNDIAMLYFSIGEYAHALPFAEESARLQPDMILLTLNLARCYIMAGKYEEAERALKRTLTQEVFQREYGKIQSLLYMNVLYRRLSQSEQRDDREAILLRLARVNISLGYCTRAFENIKAARELNPDSKIAREALRSLYEYLGASARAD